MNPQPFPVHAREAMRPNRRARRLGRKATFLFVVIGALGVVYELSWPRSPRAMTVAPAASALAVAAVEAARADLPVELQAVGTVTPLSTITVKSRISGYLTAIAFKEGQTVQKGDFLAQIDPRPYEASLAEYQGQLVKDQALLRNAQLDLARFQRLLALDSTSRQNFDTATATVRQYEGMVQSDQAQIDGQRLNIEYCHIVAPAGGRVGLRQIDPGNYVQATDANGLVVIAQIQPISVIFAIPQVQLGPVLKRLHAGASLSVSVYDSDGAALLATGMLDTVDNQIDTSTGTVKLRAIFDNRSGDLFPNQFVNVHLLVDTRHDALLIPTAAIRHGQPGAYVYLVRADDTVVVQAISAGATYGGQASVLSGLSSGDRVVVDGIDRLHDGMRVAIEPGSRPASVAKP
jgi:multidrug efflux system membrane fusion protein